MVEVYEYADSKEASYALSEYIVDAQDKVLAKEKVFRIAISGGSLVGALQEGLVLNKAIAPRVKWAQWEIYFVDERLLPLSNQDSNYGLFKRKVVNLLDSKITRPKIVAINTTLLSPSGGQDDVIATDYARRLPDHMDVVILGCGEDGHICSLFPGHKLLPETTKMVANIDDSPKPPARRITFTLPYLKKATQIAFFAFGSGKNPVLKRVFSKKEEDLPSAMVNNFPGIPVSWFVDEAAIEGAGVPTSTYGEK
ncbi:DEKNAAC102898 [Brettanomyces naardenensis]|uniref:6-phosphogluconolactonase-like protein n=1 Tax=Brettanomyces naardenensis TaxID=13370 RepID=A0A448YLX2_BRENA|nr:DEKNAAC102898 [Brettanomyces naardenensis]